MTYNTDNFIKNLETIGVPFDSFQIEKFIRYYELLIEWNDNINLTAIVDFDEVILKHFTDSLFLLKYYDIPKCFKKLLHYFSSKSDDFFSKSSISCSICA